MINWRNIHRCLSKTWFLYLIKGFTKSIRNSRNVPSVCVQDIWGGGCKRWVSTKNTFNLTENQADTNHSDTCHSVFIRLAKKKTYASLLVRMWEEKHYHCFWWTCKKKSKPANWLLGITNFKKVLAKLPSDKCRLLYCFFKNLGKDL